MSNESKTLLTQLQEAQAIIAANADALLAFDGFKAEQAKLIEGKDAEIKALSDAKIKAESDLKAAADELASVKAELATAQAALANPAFADAAIKGSAGAGFEGGVAGNGGADEMTPEQAKNEYSKLTDAKAKQDFRRKHWKALGIAEEK